MNIFILIISVLLLISLLMFINKKINFTPIFDDRKGMFILEKYQDSSDCSQSKTVTSIRSCFEEVLKGKKEHINTLENKLKNTSKKNTADINTINNKIKDINNSLNTIKKNVEDSSKLLKDKQNDIFSKANKTTEILKKAQEAKDKAQSAANS